MLAVGAVTMSKSSSAFYSNQSFTAVVVALFLLLPFTAVFAQDYGVDISYPMHHDKVSSNYPWLPHNVDPLKHTTPEEYAGMAIQPLGSAAQERYEHYIQGCVDFYNSHSTPKGNRCVHNEQDRIAMTLRQPASVYNYTEMGFMKTRAPDKVISLLRDFWNDNNGKQKPENWIAGNIYTNHWEAPTYMLSVEDTELIGGGHELKQHIWNAARDTIEEWTGHKQAECSLYGIREYRTGARLAPHVDRLPLVSSAIINVAQDVDEPWPLEVIGHDGKAYNVTMEPGDLVLYESHSVIHGRQFPLKGRFMANVFIHFEPMGPIGGQVQTTGDLPPYVIPGSDTEREWRQQNPQGHKLMGQRGIFTTGSTELHHHVILGDFDKFKEAVDKHEHLVNVRDRNGWAALHEAVRTGKLPFIELLLNRGADVNMRTDTESDDGGDSPLSLAIHYHGDDHEVTKLLKSRGARAEL